MKHTDLNRKSDRTRLLIFALLCGLLFAFCAVLSAQEAIKMPAKGGFKSVGTFKNAQGFTLPASVPDSTKVYQIGDRGAKFYFRMSKKSGQIYKVYLKKDTIK